MNEKERIRREIWAKLEESGIGRPPIFHRIPNFSGSEAAARLLAEHEIWKRAKVVKVNPDSPQRPVRLLALKEGKLVIVPTPRLKSGFLLLDPKRISNYEEACTIRGSFIWGEPIAPREFPKVDLVVVGSVAVNEEGDRLGKSEGYSEIEWAIAYEEGKVDQQTPVATTVHDIQVVDEEFEVMPYDLPVDYVFTPTRFFKTKRSRPKPERIYWEYMPRRKVEEIPLLKEMLKLKAPR